MATYRLWASNALAGQAYVVDGDQQWYYLSRDHEWQPIQRQESDVTRWAMSTPAVRTNRRFRSLSGLVKALQVESQRAVEELQPPPIATGIRDWPDGMFLPSNEWDDDDLRGDFFWAYLIELAARFPVPWAPPMSGWEDTYHQLIGASFHSPAVAAGATLRVIRELWERDGLSGKEQDFPSDSAEWTERDQSLLAQSLMVIALQSVFVRTDYVAGLLQRAKTTREIVSPWLGLYAELIHGRDGHVSDVQMLAGMHIGDPAHAGNWATSVREWHAFRDRFNFRASAVAYAQVFGMRRSDVWVTSVLEDRQEGVRQLRALDAALGQLAGDEREIAVLSLSGSRRDAHSLAMLDHLRGLIAGQLTHDEQVEMVFEVPREVRTDARERVRPRAFAARVAEKVGASARESQVFVNAVAEVMREALVAGEDVLLSGFGKFSVNETAASARVNPQTRAKVNAASGKRVKFTPGKELAEAVEAARQMPTGIVVAEDVALPMTAATREARVPATRMRILIISDDESAEFDSQLRGTLLAANYEVDVVSIYDALTAVLSDVFAQSVRSDLILLNVKLDPSVTFAKLHELRAHSETARIPTIVVYSYEGRLNRPWWRNPPAYTYVVGAPFTARSLMSVIDEATGDSPHKR